MLMDFQTPDSPKDGKSEAAQPAEQLRQAITQADRAAQGGGSDNRQNINQILGNLIIGDAGVASRPSSPADAIQQRDVKELVGKIRPLKEVPLSATEQLFADNLSSAITDANPKAISRVLAVLSENPGSIDRVMRQIREQLGRASVNWEQGKDDAGNAFVRMKLTHYDKRLGDTTQVTIGSDGASSATYTNAEGRSKPIDASSALEYMRPRKQLENWRELGAADASDTSTYKQRKDKAAAAEQNKEEKKDKVEENKEEKKEEKVEDKKEEKKEESEAEKLFKLKMKKLKLLEELKEMQEHLPFQGDAISSDNVNV
jgi:hypothetical protein